MTNEIYEVAVSEDGAVYGPFEVFVPGDVRLLGNFVKFRVTVFGDFERDEYRLRGFSGIVDDATTNVGGFGVSPFGRYPFGDGGVCLEASGGDFDGRLRLSGALLIEPLNTSFQGTLELDGEIQTDITASEEGTMTLAGEVDTVVTQPAFAALLSFADSGSFGTGTKFLSVAVNGSSVLLSTSAAADTKIPVSITLFDLRVVLTSAIAGLGSTLTARYVVNGTVSNAIVVSMGTGDQEDSATGTITLSAGDTLCLQVDTTAPGVTSGMQCFASTYKVN